MKTVYISSDPNHPSIPPGATVIQEEWELFAFRMHNFDEAVRVRVVDWPAEIPKQEPLEGPIELTPYGKSTDEPILIEGFVE